MDRIKTDSFDITNKHTFLFNHEKNDGILSVDARKIPDIRSYIDDLPETAATFQLSHIDAIDDNRIDDRIMEFIGCWQLDSRHGQGRERWVNPKYIHSGKYTDAIIDCDCGTQMTLKKDDDIEGDLMDQNNHEDHCQPFDRMRTRAAISEMRYHQLRRLSWMGWRGADIAPRLGISQRNVGATARLFGMNLEDLYHHYHAAVGKTFHCLVETKDIDPDYVTEIYDLNRTYMRRLEKRYVRENEPLPDVGETTVPAMV